MPPRSSIAWAVLNASSSRCPRRTGKTPPCVRMNSSSGGLKSCDLAMNCTSRRISTAMKKWSMKLKWFGARITGPSSGTLSTPIARKR